MQINNLLQSAESATPQIYTTTKKPQIFSSDEKDAIAYFFMRLFNVYGATKMETRWPDEESLTLARREFGRQIAKYSRDEINDTFDLVHKERRSSNSRFEWPDIDAIIGLLTNEGVFTGSAGALAHKIYEPECLLEHGTRADRKEKGKAACADILAMFDE